MRTTIYECRICDMCLFVCVPGETKGWRSGPAKSESDGTRRHRHHQLQICVRTVRLCATYTSHHIYVMRLGRVLLYGMYAYRQHNEHTLPLVA